jgi:hypothetical protein
MALFGQGASSGGRGARFFSALPDFLLAGYFGAVWVAPEAFSNHTLSRLELIMLMEFIIIHSSAFLGAAMTMPKRRIVRVLSVIGLGLFYTAFVGAFAMAFDTMAPLVSFWILLSNRMLSIVFGPAPKEDDYDFIVVGWAAAVVCYLGYTMLTSFAPIPRLGITASVQAAQPVSGGGLWAEEPWRVVALGTFYYASIAVTELFGVGMARKERDAVPAIQPAIR